ncbi:MAG: hypothetical protein J6S40_06820 [Thermoguttaceae bacterium]|nr:hypothetical protein [Thermoguttaceae bacterium]
MMPPSVESPRSEMPLRTRAGWITVVLWIATLAALAFDCDELTLGAFLRTAVCMTLLWLAWPQLCRLPRWLYISVPIVGLAASVVPRILFVLIPLLLLYGFLRPKPRKVH